eukprot:CAMPEP_0176354302 /NCGR_PEP_ID=MMETSP0126-20121128/12452_1 /TAXON_ID=141414 ORGANISM="Strombidinopsis acuminatum, Strain SPMC142" /NCGR_SAMPLE_ID=MMETSP0126 /ASSEMBLY_ACC=CAM_ASM_000229 /LENGTH=128 /DNA_ID=CAMNT_0017706403 /DNA_START=8 /DNA_END=394 /DNA_ORIENTATION=-
MAEEEGEDLELVPPEVSITEAYLGMLFKQSKVVAVFVIIMTLYGLIKFIAGILKSIAFYIRYKCRRKRNLFRRYGERGEETWVVITGATSPVGLELCRRFAEEGFNLCIIGKNEDYIIKKIRSVKLEF